MDEAKRAAEEQERLSSAFQFLISTVTQLRQTTEDYDSTGLTPVSSLLPELAQELDAIASYLLSISGFFATHDKVNYQTIAHIMKNEKSLQRGFRSVLPLPSYQYGVYDKPLPGYMNGVQFNLVNPTEAETAALDPNSSDDQITVAAYLGSDNTEAIDAVLRHVDDLVLALGYGKPQDLTIERGSIFRRSWSKAKETLTSAEMKERLAKVERAVEVQGLLLPQAEVDLKISQAVSGIIANLANIPSACIRAGSILLVKYQTDDGPMILTRNLSIHEIRTLERFPGIQKEPSLALDLLATTIQTLESENSSDFN